MLCFWYRKDVYGTQYGVNMITNLSPIYVSSAAALVHQTVFIGCISVLKILTVYIKKAGISLTVISNFAMLLQHTEIPSKQFFYFLLTNKLLLFVLL